MTFKTEGLVKQQFSRQGGKGSANSTRRPRDVLVEVVDYDLTNQVMIARDVDTNRDIRVHINPETIANQSKITPKANAKADPARYVGYLIDERMAAKVRPGSRVVLENVIAQSPTTGPDKKTYSVYEAKWVSAVPDPRPEKAFRAVITGEAWQGRMSSFQVWENKALDVEANQNDIYTYLAKMDDVNAAWSRNERPVNLGLQLRALVKKGVHQEAGKPDQPIYEVIDTTGAFSWVAPKRDASGNVVVEGHPIDQASAVKLIQDYMGYLADKFKDDPSVEYRVEVMPFREYRASGQSNKMVVRENSPLSNLAHTQTRCSPGDAETLEGKNWAVNGLIVLSKDKAPQNPGEQWETRNLVQDVFTNGYRGHVCSLVWAFDGGRVRVHPELDRVARPTYAGAATPASEANSQQAPGDDGFGSAADVFSGDEAGDVFGAVLDGQAPAAAAPATAPAPAAAPVAAPAAAPAATDATPGGRPNPNVFGARRSV